MKLNNIANSLKRTAYKTGFKFKKHSPEIYVITGIVTGVVATVVACKATLKVHAVIEEAKEDIKKVEDCKEKLDAGKTVKLKDGEEYTEKDVENDLRAAYFQTAVKITKAYLPAMVLGVISIGLVLNGHHILSKRNVALASAYTAVDQAFKGYRGRVVERFGEDLDKELRFNIKNQEVEEIVTDEDGNERIEKTVVKTAHPDSICDFARFFDETCTGFTDDHNFNIIFLKQQQEYANQRLREVGFLFLNEVYEMLGIPRIPAGQEVGWIYDKNNPIGDNYVDFGIYNSNSEATRRFVNGYEKYLLIDPNVDGYILDKI